MKAQEQLAHDLAALKLHQVAAMLQATLQEAAQKNWSSLDVLRHLISAEVAARETRALERRIGQARLPKLKTIDDYDFSFPQRIPKQRLLDYFSCDFIPRYENLILVGNQGVGKTHLLTALGYAACRKGYTVRFTRVVDMLNDLIRAQQNGTLVRAMDSYRRVALLLLDELGYLPVDKRGADLLFQVIAARYETGSIVITTNRVFKEWGMILDADPTLASALLDRLVHHGEALQIRGDSYRLNKRSLDS
jgi:DNA replication protein DnaC